MDIAVFMSLVGLVADGVEKLLHDTKIIKRSKGIADFPMIFKFPTFYVLVLSRLTAGVN
jgi:hypothetical protein